MTIRRVSPRQFDILQRELLAAEVKGHGPAACVVLACNAARIKPPRPFEPVEIVVDPEMESL